MATFGFTTAGSVDASLGGGNFQATVYGKFTLTEAGDVTQLSGWFRRTTQNHTANLAIYDDDGTNNIPSTRIAVGTPVTITGTTYSRYDISITANGLAAGNYWIGATGDSQGPGVGVVYVASESTGGTSISGTDDTALPSPANCQGTSTGTVKYSVFATYTPTGYPVPGQQIKASIIVKDNAKNNSVKANIVAPITQNNSSKANILIADNTADNSVRANLVLSLVTYSQNNSAKASIVATQTQNNSTKADILRTNEVLGNSTKADIKNTYPITSYLLQETAFYLLQETGSKLILDTWDNADIVKASILVRDNTAVNSVKADIKVTSSNNNSTKANLVATTRQANSVIASIQNSGQDPNSVKANIKATITQADSAKADILVSNNTQANSAKASIVATNTDNNSVKADIKASVSWDNSVKADIKATSTDNNSVKANVKFTTSQDGSVKANIVFTTPQANSTKANIRATTSQANNTKANVKVTTSQDNNSKADIKATTSQNNSVKADILVTNNTANNSAKASLVATSSNAESAKADIKATLTKDNSTKASITAAGQQPESVKADILVRDNPQNSSVKANILVTNSVGNSTKARIFTLANTEINSAKADIFKTIFQPSNSFPLINDPSLLSLYRLDGNSNDSVDGRNGTDTNITYVSGRYGQAASLAGNGGIYIGDDVFTNTDLASGSISVWVKRSGLPAGEETLVDFEGWVVIKINSSGNVIFWSGNNFVTDTGSAVVTDGNYHNIIMTWNGTTASLYVDKVLDKTNASGSPDLNATLRPNRFGEDASNTSRWLNGQLDEIAIFNKVLSSGEINTLGDELLIYPVKANILVTNNVSNNSTKACIVGLGLANNSVKASIVASQSKNNASLASLVATDQSPTSSKANILFRGITSDVATKANVVAPQFQSLSTKASLVSTITSGNSAKGHVVGIETQENLVKANILRIGETQENQVGASLIRSNIKSANFVRAHIRHVKIYRNKPYETKTAPIYRETGNPYSKAIDIYSEKGTPYSAKKNIYSDLA